MKICKHKNLKTKSIKWLGGMANRLYEETYYCNDCGKLRAVRFEWKRSKEGINEIRTI